MKVHSNFRYVVICAAVFVFAVSLFFNALTLGSFSASAQIGAPIGSSGPFAPGRFVMISHTNGTSENVTTESYYIDDSQDGWIKVRAAARSFSGQSWKIVGDPQWMNTHYIVTIY